MTAGIDAALNEYEALWDRQDPAGPSKAESVRMRFDGVQARWLAKDLAFSKFMETHRNPAAKPVE